MLKAVYISSDSSIKEPKRVLRSEMIVDRSEKSIFSFLL